MKRTLISGILAAGLASSSAFAETPLMDAFSDLLGACWGFVGEGRIDEIYSATEPAPNFETLCFEQMENHFIRIRRHRSGSHGSSFFNEEILHWNATDEKIVSVMFTSSVAGGHVVFRSGMIENDIITFLNYRGDPPDTSDYRERDPVNGQDPLTLYGDRGESAAISQRFHWSAVEDDQFSVLTEQDLGDDYGGWTTQHERIFTRQDASAFDELSALMTGGPMFSQATDLFEPLLGACWSAEIADSDVVDTHCFSDLLGRYVRDRHIIPGNPAYSGETIFFYDGQNDSIDFLYFNSIGGMSDGYDAEDWNGITYYNELYLGPDGQVQIFGGGYVDISYDGYTSVIEEFEDGDWTEVSRQRFTRTDHNPFETRGE